MSAILLKYTDNTLIKCEENHNKYEDNTHQEQGQQTINT